MNEQRFDAVTRFLVAPNSRRGVLRHLAALVLAGGFACVYLGECDRDVGGGATDKICTGMGCVDADGGKGGGPVPDADPAFPDWGKDEDPPVP
jgi:hypothetical protein